MLLNATIRELIRIGANRELVRLIPAEVTGAARLKLFLNIMRRRWAVVLATWPSSGSTDNNPPPVGTVGEMMGFPFPITKAS